MGKNKKNKIQAKQLKSETSTLNNTSNQVLIKPPIVSEEPVTIETIEKSANQTEFDNNKKKLIEALIEEINQLKKQKADEEEKANKARQDADEVQRETDKLKKQEKELQDNVKKKQEEYNQLTQKNESLEKSANEIVSKAEEEAKNIKQKAEEEAQEERISIIDKANECAKNAYREKADKLQKDYDEISKRESELDHNKRQFAKQQLRFNDEKEAFEIEREDIRRKIQEFNKANPQIVFSLKEELEYEKGKYEALKEAYDEKSKQLQQLQVFMDTVKAEVNFDNINSTINMSTLFSDIKSLRNKYDELSSLCKDYPSIAEIRKLEREVERTQNIEDNLEKLEKKHLQCQEELNTYRNIKRHKEILEKEIETARALNEHLVKELESHKIALESRTGDTCPALSKVDIEVEAEDFSRRKNSYKSGHGVTSLEELVKHVKEYAANTEKLYYTDNDIRAFIASMAVSRLIILEGMSGTGKSSLPRVFANAISGQSKLIPVESSWRDRNELLGYYNDFNKKFNAKTFTVELYRSCKDEYSEISTFIVLDEMNLARIEYYFSDFLAILQEPDPQKWLIELVSSDMRTLPMKLSSETEDMMRNEAPEIYSIWENIQNLREITPKNNTGKKRSFQETSEDEKRNLTELLSRMGKLTGAKSLIDGRKIKISENVWFIGTANKDESTFEISDKVYDRAQIISLNTRSSTPDIIENQKLRKIYVSVSQLTNWFKRAKNKEEIRKKVANKLGKLDEILISMFYVSFGNRIVSQAQDFVSVYISAGGTFEDALDYQISTKIIRKIINSDDREALLYLCNALNDYTKAKKMVLDRIGKLDKQ